MKFKIVETVKVRLNLSPQAGRPLPQKSKPSGEDFSEYFTIWVNNR